MPLDVLKIRKFSRGLNFHETSQKSRENKTLAKWQTTLSFIDICKPCLNRELFTSLDKNMSFNAIRENKILAKISESTVHQGTDYCGKAGSMYTQLICQYSAESTDLLTIKAAVKCI